ncbi:IclR family transcriptional regulator [Ramlibacter sp.]|uniref:IclR family transcriptional regulator n=1 Tax=Ramlibacter sp. TaxID=1917967 RepID=UPI003D148747
MNKSDPLTGTRSAAKALALLRLVGLHHPGGVRLTDLIASSGQDRSTAHRLLACLEEYGFVERALPSKAYRLGLSALEMGLVSTGMRPVVERFLPLMRRLARQTDDTVFLMVRSADHVLCLHREEGTYPVKVLTAKPGMRLLLGISLAGVAIMAHMEEPEVVAAYERYEEEYRMSGVSLPRLCKAWLRTRAAGFADLTDHRHEVTRGVACAIRYSPNSFVGISIAAINSRMPKQRRAELGASLSRELQTLAWKGRGIS